MAKIPSALWVVVGLIVAITSWSIEIPLFFWLGWVFVLVGIMKFLVGYMTNEKETREERKRVHPAQHAQYAHHAAHQYYRCSCSNPVKATDNFCGHCGRRLR